MTIALASIKEGSEESRTKRAVRRYLNKKKGKPVDEATVIEGSEEDRQKRAKRIEQKKKGKKEPLEESVIRGSVPHMEHSVHSHHFHGIESPDYHIHAMGRHRSEEGNKTHYIIIHKHGISMPENRTVFPAHHIIVTNDNVHHMGHVQ